MAIVFIIVCTSLPQPGRWNVVSLVMGAIDLLSDEMFL
jgi:hypothetical protein